MQVVTTATKEDKVDMSMLEITLGYWPFSDQFQHLANQIHFIQPYFLYIFNGTVINNL